MDDITIIRYFEDIFQEDEFRRVITEVGTAYPDKKSINLDFELIDDRDLEFGTHVLGHPLSSVKFAEESIQRILPPDIKHPLNVRIHNLPNASAVRISSVRDEILGTLVSISGIVRKATTRRSRIIEAHFMCARCGFDNIVPQHNHLIQEPFECQGCEKPATRTKFQLLEDFCDRIDFQELYIQELPENLEGGDIPEPLRVIADDDLAGMLQAGRRCTISGVVLTEDRSKGRSTSTIQDYLLKAIHIHKHEDDYQSIEISSEDETRILRYSRDPEIFEKFTRSIATSIHGETVIKEALVLQQFGGVRKEMPDKSFLRGDIHILLIGDPGTAKSQLLRIVSKIAPRGTFASGQATTKAGLTAAAIQDEGNRWTFEAGALPLADGGMICIDEMDKMNPEDRSSMHEGMEQQEITLSKAGMNVTLFTRCPVLAAANPIHGRFDTSDSFLDQINLPPTLLTRFDLIFAFLDNPLDIEKDIGITEKILSDFTGDFEIEPLDPDFIKKYISHAKSIEPELTKPAKKRIREFYLQQRRGSRNTIQITPRQLQALIRLSAASARVRLSPKILVSDADRAIRIYGHAIAKLCFEDGVINIDRLEVHKIKKSIRESLEIYLSRNSPVDSGVLIKAMKRKGFPKDRIEGALSRLLSDGRAYEQGGKICGI